MIIFVSSSISKTIIYYSKKYRSYLEIKEKSNARQLTKHESKELENIKLAAFLALEPMCELSDKNLHKALSSNNLVPKEYKQIRTTSTSMDGYKKMVVGLYVEQFVGEK